MQTAPEICSGVEQSLAAGRLAFLYHQRRVKPATVLIFDGYQDGHRYIDIYARVARYELRGGRAFEVTRKGRREVSIEYARQRVREWKEREARTLTVTPTTRRQMWYLVTGWALVAGAMVATLLLLF